jgi:hypothetical protein
VITVAATGATGNRSYYSNFGTSVEIAAPGGDKKVASNGTVAAAGDLTGEIASTLNSGLTTPSTDIYAYYQGTSMATPVVAGAAALLEGRWPVLKTQPARVATILLNSATDLGATGVDPVYGRGLLNVGRAFQSSGLAAIVAPSGQRTVVSSGAVSVSPVMRRAWKVMSGVTAFDEHGRDYQLGQIHNLKVRSTDQDPGSSAASAIDMGGQASWAPDFFAGPSAPASTWATVPRWPPASAVAGRASLPPSAPRAGPTTPSTPSWSGASRPSR